MLEYNHNHEELLDVELQFWKKWFKNEGGQWHDDYTHRTNDKSEIDINSWHLSGISQEDKILDVGCGPIPICGARLKGKKIQIVGVDPLAEEYNKLIEKYAPQVEFRGIKGTGENLLDIFGNEEFDMVISRNALDHSENPILCIQNMIKVCKKNGIVRFDVSENEGLFENYSGLHKWNFTLYNKKLKLWNKEEKVFMVEDYIDCKYMNIISGDRHLSIEIKPQL